jgi:hypothetical protein
MIVVLVALFAAPAAGAAKKAKPCPAGQVRRTITYVHHKGGPVDHATGCVVKNVIIPTSVAAAQSKLRALAATLVPAKVARAFKTSSARKVAAIDAKTDAAFVAYANAHAPMPEPVAQSAFHGVHAIAAETKSADGNSVTNDNGTETKHADYANIINTAEDSGEDWQSTTTTKATRVTGARAASTKRVLKVRYVMNKCPDATGASHGTLDISQRITSTSGTTVIGETATLNAQVIVHFGDNAQFASVEVIGTWKFTSHTAHSNRSVSGNVSASNGQVIEGRAYVDLSTTVTTGTDDNIAAGGGLLGAYIAHIVGHDYVVDMIGAARGRPEGGGCVHIVPNADTVHVKLGGSVAIVAHLTDHHDQTFSGPMYAINTSGRVNPADTQADTDATLTYYAPLDAKGGDTDIVRLTHASKRGKGHDAMVNVVIDPRSGFPHQYDGTWTRVTTYLGITVTVHGTATYVHNPVFPAYLDGTTSIPYDVVSASVTWAVTNPAGPCSGGGSADATQNDALGATAMTLEDVSANPYAPHPEPRPFYYSLRAHGDAIHPPTYPCGPTTESIGTDYLDIGHVSPIGPESSFDDVVKSDNINLLHGHLEHDESGLHVVDDWSFTGSG